MPSTKRVVHTGPITSLRRDPFVPVTAPGPTRKVTHSPGITPDATAFVGPPKPPAPLAKIKKAGRQPRRGPTERSK